MILIALLLLLLPGPLGESIFLEEEDSDEESGMLILELTVGAKLIFGVRRRLADSIYA